MTAAHAMLEVRSIVRPPRTATTGAAGSAPTQAAESSARRAIAVSVRQPLDGALRRRVETDDDAASHIHCDMLGSVGQPLDHALRQRMEARLGTAGRALTSGISREFRSMEAAADTAAEPREVGCGRPRMDFSAVRLHADRHAASAARRLHSRAFTIGEHIYADPAAIPAGEPERDRLIAHELAHVAQQRTIGRRLIQPYLIATGDYDEIRRFFRLAEAAMGERLLLDPANHRVTAISCLDMPRRSPAFADAMHQIMDRTNRNAEARFGAGQRDINVAGFPSPANRSGSRAQTIDMDDVEAIEAGAPGSGLAMLAHELTENFAAHPTAPATGMGSYDDAHEVAMTAESNVAEELVGPGRRVAQATFRAFNRSSIAFDYENYFVVINSIRNPRSGSWDVTSSARQPRRNLIARVIDHYDPGSPVMPPAGAAVVAEVARAVAGGYLATVHVTGFTDNVEAPATTQDLSADRALGIKVRLQISGVSGPDQIHTDGLGATRPVAPNDNEANRARNRRVVVAAGQPGI
jgi:outer membrane protein OmpA-like peptidoglycan-associated protein